jgi:hypothetical protein
MADSNRLLISDEVSNPFRPGAGHPPPYLAGRETESREFAALLRQTTITENFILTGLRGLGKTVLLDRLKPLAIQSGWLWAGTDLSESTSVSEETLVTRLITDLAVVTSSMTISHTNPKRAGFGISAPAAPINLTYPVLRGIHDRTAGLPSDKVKAVLEFVWPHIDRADRKGVVFAYDEAQNLADHAAKEQYPLSLLLDVFQSLQRKGMRFMLVLTGLPTLFPKLVEARTYSERMFHVVFLNPLTEADTKDAIEKPINDSNSPITVTQQSIAMIWQMTRGYPYFVQYVCREAFDLWVQALRDEEQPPAIPIKEIVRKLDTDFFAGRWARVTDRQRDLLSVIAYLPNCNFEFTVQEIVGGGSNRKLAKPFSSSHISQMLVSLANGGLVYKNRHGKYSFAVPLLGDFIKRQETLALEDSGQEPLF